MNLIKFFLLAGSLILASCFRDETIKLSECSNCNIPVIICFLTTTDSISAYLFETTAFGQNSKDIDALIELTDSAGNCDYFSHDNIEKSRYNATIKKIKIISGNKYYLRVKLNDGRILSSETTLPNKSLYWKEIKYIGQQSDGETNLFENTFLCTWENKSNIHYLIGQSDTIKQGSILDSLGIDISSEPKDSFLSNIILTRISVTPIDSITYQYIHSSYSTNFSLNLFTINDHMYKFLNSYNFYSNLHDDVTTESVFEMYKGVIPEYTNINGGLGVFGAYLVDKKIINYKIK